MAAKEGSEATTKPRRKNKPEYVVFRLVISAGGDDEPGLEAWEPVLGHNQQGEPKSVQAASRKEAIVKATAGGSGPQEGAFMVVPKIEAQILKRKTRTQVVDEFK